MPIVSINNTLASISLIKKGVQRIVFIIQIFFYICFVGYNVYLVVTNFNNTGRFICYSALLLCTIAGFVFLFLFKKELTGNNREKNKQRRNRYKLKWVVSIVKYINKFALVGLAFYDIMNNSEATMIMKVSTLISFIMTILLLITELSMIIVNKYIDYILLSIELDMNESAVISGRNKIGQIIGIYEEDETNKNYSKYEEKLIGDIKNEVEVLDLNKQTDKAVKKEEMVETLKKNGLFNIHKLIDKVKEKLDD